MVQLEKDGYWLVMEATIAKHHEDVFECFTTSSGLTLWFPVAAEVELRQGGNIVLGWDEKFNRKTTIAILNYSAGGEIVWDWQTRRTDTHVPIYWKVIPSMEEGSRVEFRQGPFRDNKEALLAMVEEAVSWRWYLCNLRTVLEAAVDMRKIRPL